MPDLLLSRLASMLLLFIGSLLIITGTGHFFGADTLQIAACCSAVLPWFAAIAILLLLDWIWEYVTGTWGIWEARKDLRLLAHDLSIVETWRMGGWLGSRGFLALFWASIGTLAACGPLFLVNATIMMLPHGQSIRARQDDISDLLVYALFPLWALYAVYLRYWRWKHPRPALPKAAIPAVPSVEAWRKQKLLKGPAEALAFLALFQTACPEFAGSKPFPWKILVFSLPALSWHFYLWAGGTWNLPMAASISLDMLGCASVFWSLGWLLPWTINQTQCLLRPDGVPLCRYLPILRLRSIAIAIARQADYPQNP